MRGFFSQMSSFEWKFNFELLILKASASLYSVFAVLISIMTAAAASSLDLNFMDSQSTQDPQCCDARRSLDFSLSPAMTRNDYAYA